MSANEGDLYEVIRIKGLGATLNFPEEQITQGHKSSIYYGVLWNNETNGWIINVNHDNESFYRDLYDSEEPAARVYDEEVVSIKGKGARLNFPEKQKDGPQSKKRKLTIILK